MKRISLEEAKKLAVCCSWDWHDWMDSAKWYFGRLEPQEFQDLRVYYNGPSNIGWQAFTNGSSMISEVAIKIYEYSGTDPQLLGWRNPILEYEARMEQNDFPAALCLVRTGESGHMTTPDTNERALAYYIYHYVKRIKEYTPIAAGVAQIATKLSFQSE